MATFQTLPGFREFYPEDLAKRSHIFRMWRRFAGSFGFSEYDAPVLEPLALYKAKSGDEIEGQLFSFVDKGGREVALRPEMTPTVCRLVGERAGSLKRPIKWFSIGEFYRYERMQKGRGRCFTQFNADLFGEPGPEAEIELIGLLVECLRGFGLTPDDCQVRLSDRNLWLHFLSALGLDDERAGAVLSAVDRHEKLGDEAFAPYAEKFGTPLDGVQKSAIVRMMGIRSFAELEGAFASPQAFVERMLGGDGKAPDHSQPEELLEAAEHGLLKNIGPVVLQTAFEKISARLADWRRLLAGLEAMGIGDFIAVDFGVVRGLAYYTGFVFEAFDRKGELRAIAGGGRYDNLVAKLGGQDMPAVGFAIGDMTFALLLEQRGLTPAVIAAPDVYCVLGGPAERLAAFRDISALRSAGFRVDYPLKDLSFGKQFKAAAEAGARVALIYGGDELAKGVVRIRDMTDRSERDVPRAAVGDAVRDLISGSAGPG